MKGKMVQLMRSLLPVLFVAGSVSVFGQPPANDKCSGAIEITIADSKDNSVPIEGDTRNTTDGNLDNINSCSANFKRDDIWYKFVAPDPVPENGWTIEFEFGSKASDINIVGFALHANCMTGAANNPLYCSVESPGRKLEIGTCPSGIIPGETYYLRVWSAEGLDPNWQEGSGTFRIFAYENDEMLEPILWGDQPGQGDFDGGINGWTAVGLSCAGGAPSDSATWVWDPIGDALSGAYAGGQVNLSPTYCNGAMVFNSDYKDNLGIAGNFGAGPCPAPQSAELISPVIDISAFNVTGVSLEFHQNLREFQSQYFVGYSLDGGQNWIDIEINATVEVNSPHINEIVRVPLPGAEGAANLRVKFRMDANYYYWVIDDVRIVERECNNMAANNFFAQVPYAQWQKDQLHNFGAMIDIENLGACPQTGVFVDFEIRNAAGDVVVSGTKDYGTLAIDSLAENDMFDECFDMPADSPVGQYFGSYTVRSDSADFDISDNQQFFTFFITEQVYGKDIPNGPTGSIRATEFPNWRFGNGYHIVKGGPDCTFCQVEVGIGNASELRPSVIGAQARLVVRVYEYIFDVNQDGMIDLNSEALQVGFTEYEFTNEEEDGTIYLLDIFDENFEPCVLLKDNTTYFVFAEYTEPAGVTGTLMHVLSGTTNSYVATNFLYAPLTATDGGLGSPCLTSFGDVADLGNTGILSTSGTTYSPIVRMILDCDGVSTEPVDPASSAIQASILPNPVNDVIRVDMNFPTAMDRVSLRITDMNGRVILEETQSFAAGQATWTKNIAQLANGAYLLNIISAEGVRTDRFVVQH